MIISRRSFLKGSGAAAAISLAGGAVVPVLGKTNSEMQVGPGNKWPGRVVINYNKNALVSTKYDQAIIKKMIDDSIMLLTDMKTVGDAWKSIFPSITETTKIAIKVPCGCASSNMAPHWSSVKAIIDGLVQMNLDGKTLPLANITVYDMNCQNRLSGYGYTSANLPGVNIIYDTLGSNYTDGAKNLQYAKSLNGAAYLINVFRPGGHWVEMGGFTLGFKNHYGTYTYNHSKTEAQPYIRDINCTGVVFNKNALSLCVGLNGATEIGQPTDTAKVYNYYVQAAFDPSVPDPNGTSTDVAANTIIMSTDPISAEMQTVKLMRLNNKPAKKYGMEDMPNYLKASAGISGALSDKTYNIGIIDEAKMSIRRIINGEVVKTGNTQTIDQLKGATNRWGISAAHLNAQRVAFIEFSLPETFIGKNALFEVYDIKGKMIHSANQYIAGTINHFTWNEKLSRGQRVAPGIYIVRLIAGTLQLSGRLNISTR